MDDYNGLIGKVQRYHQVLANTRTYRERWTSYLKAMIIEELNKMLEVTGLSGKVETADKVDKPLIKHNGSLIYQQLFNGKVQVMIAYPFIEGFGEPRQPRLVAIYRPEELKTPFLIRHMEDFIRELTQWEDLDDDDQQANKIGFQLQPLQAPQKSITGEE